MSAIGNIPAHWQCPNGGEPRAAMPSAVRIGMLLTAALVFANSFDISGASDEADVAVDRQIYLRLALCSACGMYGLYFLSDTIGYLRRLPSAWMLLFGVWTLFTVPFSDNTSYVAAATGALGCVILFAPAVLVQLGGRRIVASILVGLFAYILATWFQFFFMPEMGRMAVEFGRQGTLFRVGGSPNELGLQCTWAVGLMLALTTQGGVQWKKLWPLFCLAILTVILAQSRTAMLAMTGVIGLFVVRRVNISLVVAVVFMAMILLSAAGLLSSLGGSGSGSVDALLATVSRTKTVDEIYTFTGRTDIWQFAIGKIREAPWMGYGYGGARFPLTYSDYDTGYPIGELRHAHNLFVNVILTTGLLGGLLVAGMLASQLRALWKYPSALPDVATTVVAVAGLTEPVLFGPMPRVHTLIWLLALCWRQVGATLHAESHVGQRHEHPMETIADSPQHLAPAWRAH